MQEATRLFADQGYAGTSIQAIADAVGIRKPSLLYHFGSKDALRECVLDEMLARWNDVLPQVLVVATRERQFDAVMKVLCGFFVDRPERARLILRETLDRPEHMRARILQYVRPWVDVIASQIERAKADGLVRPDVDGEVYAFQVITMVVGSTAVRESLGQAPARGTTDSAAGPDDDRDRFVRELTRMARASLYTNGTAG